MKMQYLIGVVLMILTGCTKEPVELAVIETDYGRMIIRFFEEDAPMHVENFKILTNEGYFDGTTFHRVIPEFVIQGGDPNTKDDDRSNDGFGGRAGKYFGIGDENNPDTWMVPAEFNDRRHIKGVLSMARGQKLNSASSQFFICAGNVFQLDHKYTVFGEVIEGLDIIEKIVNVNTPKKMNQNYMRPDGDNPVDPVRMKVWITSDKELGITLPKDK